MVIPVFDGMVGGGKAASKFARKAHAASGLSRRAAGLQAILQPADAAAMHHRDDEDMVAIFAVKDHITAMLVRRRPGLIVSDVRPMRGCSASTAKQWFRLCR
jgi:hypothetical protein